MWDFLWTKWHWDRLFSEFFGFSCQYHSTMALALHTYITWGMNNKPVGGSSSEASSHPINKNNYMNKPAMPLINFYLQ
jgi:hypothetical protein